jgi:hypothetical protein
MRQSSDIPALRGRWQSAADALAAVSDPDFPTRPPFNGIFLHVIDGGSPLRRPMASCCCAFPEYEGLVPPLAATTADFATPDVLAALARLTATSSHESPTVGMSWDGSGTVSLCLVREDGIAADAIAATTTGSGRIACSVARLTKVVKAMDAACLCLSVDAAPGAALRLDTQGRRGGGNRADQMDRSGLGFWRVLERARRCGPKTSSRGNPK